MSRRNPTLWFRLTVRNLRYRPCGSQENSVSKQEMLSTKSEQKRSKHKQIPNERGYSDQIRRAIMSHAEYTGVTRETPLEKALFACDELAGLITATALVKPSKSLAEVDAKSVRKKMKDKAFARSVNRDDIVNGARELGVDLDEHIAFCIEAMKRIAPQLGL